jgi:hypothetical protein
MTDAIMREYQGLYTQSSKLRTIARMLEGNGDTERPSVTFNPAELDGFSSLLVAVANKIDAVRDAMSDIFENEEG